MEPPSPNGVPAPPSSGPPLPKDVDKSRSQSSAAQDYLNMDVTPNALVRYHISKFKRMVVLQEVSYL